jgi:hypothetical protein
MNIRLGIASFLLGILTAFVMWSFQFVLESRREVAYDIPGDVTVLTMVEGPWIIAPADAVAAREQLKTYLRDRSLAMVIASYGIGRPEMIIYDPYGLVPWFPRATPEDSPSALAEAYLFSGTYSERRWSESARPPLLPDGLVVKGVIATPHAARRFLGGLQHVRRLGDEPLPPGEYAISTIAAADVRYILDLLRRMGLTAMRAPQGIPVPTIGRVILNPLFIFTSLLLVSGLVCTGLYWSLYLRGRAREFGIRSRHGAHPLALVRENFVGGLPGLVTGSLLGVFGSGLMVAAIARVPFLPGNVGTLAGVGVTAFAVLTMWSAVLYVVTRSHYEVRLAG